MEDHAYQVQHMLADELNAYSGQGNQYMNDNIKEIQELYKDREQTKYTNQEQVEDKEVILIKPYEISSSLSTKSSFIDDEVDNLLKYMKFICSPTQTRIFQPSPHYQSLKSRGEQNQEFWRKVATALVENKYNTEIAQNGYSITMYQGGPPYELYFIAIDNREQVIIGPNKKTVATHIVEDLKVLI